MYINRKYERSSHNDCNMKVKLNQNIPRAFLNLKNYDSHLIMQELGKLDFKINIIPNGLEKYMNIINKLTFIDSFQFLSSWLHILTQNFAKDSFIYFSQEFDNKILDLVKQKMFFTCEYMSGF